MKVSPLRQRMLDVLQLRGCASSTADTYTRAVGHLSRYYQRSPDQISPDEVQQWLLWLLKERGVSPSTYRQYFNGVRFLYVFVLDDAAFAAYNFTMPKLHQRLPDLLSRDEVRRLITHAPNAVYRLMLLSCYACGLRVSELVSIRIGGIDGERRLLHIDQGKGHKDRYVPVPASLLLQWRQYWQKRHPDYWLFPNRRQKPIHITSVQKAYRHSKSAAGIHKHGGIHSLRHAFATHSLQAGMPVQQLQRILGHRHLSTTMRYVHWLPELRQANQSIDLIEPLAL